MALGERSDIPRQYFLKLLESASATVHARLEAANPQAVAAIRDTIDDVATAMQREVRKTLAHMRQPCARPNDGSMCARSPKPACTGRHTRRTSKRPVERALLDEGEDIVLLLAKAAGCSWTTARELLLMYVANRSLRPDDITRAFERYRKLNETARNIVAFYERRMVLRAKADEKNEDAPRQDTVDNDTIDDDVIFVPSPSTAPL